MQISAKQAHVLANIEHVTALSYKLQVASPVPRYQLDGEECTAQITGLVVRKLVGKSETGRLERINEVQPTMARGKRAAARQPHSDEAVELVRLALLAPTVSASGKIAP